ncbi:MAG: BamA/TamA family outer membrane protein [Bryobacter sp.]|nr:BamA/TamA family outer membrane protein [Bryobacter sp.]
MKCLIAIAMAATVLLFPHGRAVAFLPPPADPGGSPMLPASATNVNERYTVEDVSIRNWRGILSRGLEREMRRLIGRPLRTRSIEIIQSHIEYEFPGYSVARRLEKGDRPDFVRVYFDLERKRRRIDFRSPRVLYSSAQQFSFGVDTNLNLPRFQASAGYLTDNDERVERFEGFRGHLHYDLPTERRLRIGVRGSTYAVRWNPVLAAEDQRYQSHNTVEPFVEVQVRPGLDLQTGFRFHQLEMLSPAFLGNPAAGGNVGSRNLSANSFFTTLRYTKRWLSDSPGATTLDAGYDLRAASSSFGSDFGYQRHSGSATLTWRNADLPQNGLMLASSLQYGYIQGQAPLFDRFVAGNSRFLRGWNRFDFAPTGGSRFAHLSLDGRYRYLRLSYDTGTLWDPARPKVLRHSAGIGLTLYGWTAMLAFPLRSGPIEPVLLVGMNF